MPTLPPRSLSFPDPDDGNCRALRLPNGTCTYLSPATARLPDARRAKDLFQYEGWEAASWEGPEAQIAGLTDDEIIEICLAEPPERDALIAAISTRRKVARIVAGITAPERPGWIVCEGAKIRVDSIRGVLRPACNAIEIVWEGGRSVSVVCADEAEADREEALLCSMIPGLADLVGVR